MYRRKTNPQMVLKPQDLVIVIKLCTLGPQPVFTYESLASELGITGSEVHSGIRRAEVSRLVSQGDKGPQPSRTLVCEFLIGGAQYAFPATRTETQRGMATSWGAPPLRSHFVASNEEAPVWPTPTGTARGPGLFPLYPSVPTAATRDNNLYELLALFDAIRDGRARERELARELLEKRLLH